MKIVNMLRFYFLNIYKKLKIKKNFSKKDKELTERIPPI